MVRNEGSPTVPQHLSQEDQFRERKIVLGGLVEYIDLKPGHETLLSNFPIFLAPGWSENPDLLKQVMFPLVNKGYRVVSMSKYPSSDTRPAPSGYNQFEAQKAGAIKAVIEDVDSEKVRLFARSQGGINAIIAAHMAPEKIHDIVLESAAGLDGEHHPIVQYLRVVPQIAQSTRQALRHPRALFKPINATLQEGVKYIVNDFSSANNGVHAIARTETTAHINELHDHGVGIAVVHGVHDKLFPMKEVQRHVRYAKNKGTMTEETKVEEMEKAMVDIFLSIDGDHLSIHKDPALFAELIDYLFTKLAERREKEK